MSTKEYFNKEYYDAIKEKMPKEKYGEFTKLIYEICLRRAYTFNLTKEEILKDVDCLLENCDTIQFSDNFGRANTLGHVILVEKLLEINSLCFEKNNDFEKMYETLTHEIYHAMSGKKDENNKKYTGIQYLDEFGKIKGRALNEVFNEVAADMASYSRDINDEKEYRRKTKGYASITFISTLLAGALGVSEKELVKKGISSREEFMNFLLSKVPENEKDNFISEFELFESDLYVLKVMSDKKQVEITDDDKLNMQESYTNIINFSLNILYASIINDNRTITPEIQKEYEYRKCMMDKLIRDSKEKFKPKFPENSNDKIGENINSVSRNRLNSLVIAYNYLSKIEKNIEPEELDEAVKIIKNDYPQKKYLTFRKYSEQLFQKCDSVKFDNKAKLSQVRYSLNIDENEYMQIIRKREFDDFKKWDNSKVSEKLENIFCRYLETKKLKNELNSEEENITPTIKDIAQCDQGENITTEEILNVKDLFSKMIVLEQNKESEVNDRI